MSAEDRLLRKNPEEVRRDSVQPRESYVRVKRPEDLDAALDDYLRSQDGAPLLVHPKETITAALTHRLRTGEPKSLVAFGTRMNDAVVNGMASDTLGLQRNAIEFARLMPRSEFVRPLLALALDSGEPLRSQAREALTGYEGLLYGGCAWLRTLLVDVDTTQQRRRRSMELLVLFGDPRSLVLLTDLLGHADRTVARTAHDALRTLTCHDLGTMRSAWQRWAAKNQTTSRVDWLIEALADRRPELREGALTALTRITGQSFGVVPGAQRADFLVAQEQFAALRLNSPDSIRGVSLPPTLPTAVLPDADSSE